MTSGEKMIKLNEKESTQKAFSNYALTENDKKVIAVLDRNARLSNEKIGKEVGLTRQTVAKIIKKLEDEKIIYTYKAIMDYGRLGYSHFLLLIKVKSSYGLEDIIEASRKIDLTEIGVVIFYCGYFNGEYDFALLFGANDLSHAFSVVNILKHFSRESIQEIKLQEAVVDLAVRNVSNPKAMDKMRLLFPNSNTYK